jgi:hypothetical protein
MSARPGLCGGHQATGVPTAITGYTLNSTYVEPATKNRFESFVQLKDSATKGTQRSSSSIKRNALVCCGQTLSEGDGWPTLSP